MKMRRWVAGATTLVLSLFLGVTLANAQDQDDRDHHDHDQGYQDRDHHDHDQILYVKATAAQCMRFLSGRGRVAAICPHNKGRAQPLPL